MIGKRLLDIIEEHFGRRGQAKFAKSCGIPAPTLSGYIKKNQIPNSDFLIVISNKFKVDINWLLTGVGSKHLPELVTTTHPDDFAQIPLVDVQLSAGNGSFVNSEEVKEYYQFRKDWLTQTVTSSKNAILVGVTGNSMEPTIYNGDVVMIDTGRTHIYEGEMYALRMDNTVMIKRLSHRPGDKVMIMSDNKEEYESYETKRKNIHVLAQVVWYARTLVKTDAYR